MTASPRRTAWYSRAGSQGGPRGAAAPVGRAAGTPSPRQRQGPSTAGPLGRVRAAAPLQPPTLPPPPPRIPRPCRQLSAAVLPAPRGARPPTPRHRRHGGNGALGARWQPEGRLVPRGSPDPLLGTKADGTGSPALGTLAARTEVGGCSAERGSAPAGGRSPKRAG